MSRAAFTAVARVASTVPGYINTSYVPPVMAQAKRLHTRNRFVPSAAEYTDSELGPTCNVIGCIAEAFAWFDEHWHCVEHTERIIERENAQWLAPNSADALAASGIWEDLRYR